MVSEAFHNFYRPLPKSKLPTFIMRMPQVKPSLAVF